VATRAVNTGSRPQAAANPEQRHAEAAGPGDAAERPQPALTPPGWAPVTSTVICLLALADAAYLTYIHYANPTGLACSTSGFINCTAVTTSIYSHPFGIPVATAGLVWSFVMLLLCNPWAWRAASPWVWKVRLAGAVAGVGMVFYLLYVELFSLGHLCEYCTVVHVLTIALFIVVALGTAMGLPVDEDQMAAAD